MDIKKMANRLARQHDSRNPFEIIKGLNVILLFVHLDGIRGFYQYFQRNNIIYINEDLPEHEKMWVCAHELGHMLLHKKANAIFMDTHTNLNVDKYEIEANTFAAELLISDDFMIENQEYTVNQIARMTGYSEELIRLKIKGYGWDS